MRILVTGVAGFIARHLVPRLKEAGHVVIGLDKANNATTSASHLLEEFRGCDLSIGDLSEECCKNIDIVIHLAGIASTNQTMGEYAKHNIQASKNLFLSAIKYKIRKLIYMSSIKVDASDSNYAKSKLTVENCLMEKAENADIAFTVLRSSPVYGPGMKSNIMEWLQRVKDAATLSIPESESRIAMIGLDDLCAAIIECIDNESTDNKIYALSDGHSYGINQIESEVRNIFNNKPESASYPRWLLFLGAKTGDLINRLGGRFPLHSDTYQMLFHNVAEHDNRFEKDTGFRARQDFLKEIPELLSDNNNYGN